MNRIPATLKLFIIALMPVLFIYYFINPILWVTYIMPVHELGHAVAAWLGGRMALPILVGAVTLIGYERSMVFSIIEIAGLLALAYWAFQKDKKEIMWLLLICLVVLIKFSFLITNEKLNEYILLSGVVFELIIPAFLLSLFFLNYLKISNWFFWRLPIGLYGVMGLVANLFYWFRVYFRNTSLPMGSALSSEGAASRDGDLNRLMQLGWTEVSLKSFFIKVWVLSLIVVLVSIIYSFFIESEE